MAISGTTAIGAEALATKGIGQEDLFQLLLTQMAYQDPLKPVDNQQFIAQLAQFTVVEQGKQLAEKMDTLLALQTTSQAVGLIGRSVDIDNGAGIQTGSVLKVDFVQGVPTLSVKTSDGTVLTGLRLGQISVVM